jgi:preprotein translocase subunit SecD
MSTIRDLLQEADPLRVESEPSAADRGFQRRAILEAVAATPLPAAKSRSRIPVYLGIILTAVVVFAATSRLWSPFINNVQAGVRFEVRLAERNPAPGLKEAKVAGEGGSIYLHNEVIVTNSDIEKAEIIPQPGGSQYSILVTFNPAGARKIHAATEKHIGKPIAILIDGEVVAAPTIRDATAEGAKVDNLTKEKAEKIVAGIRIR